MGETNKRRISNVKIGSVLIIGFLLLYIPSLLHWVYGNDISTDIIRNGVLEDTLNIDGYIVRDEITFKSPFDGTYMVQASEGEKVPANFTVATVLKNSSQKLIKDMKDIDLNILKVKKEKTDIESLFSEDVVKIDDQIAEKLGQVIKAANGTNIDDEGKIKDEINALMQKKASIVGNTSTANVYVNSLIKKKSDLQTQINSNTYEIISKLPGTISYIVDGYENILTPGSIKKLTPKILDGINASDGKNKLNDKEVYKQNPFVKIIKSFKYNIVIQLDRDKLIDWENERARNLNKGDDKEIKAGDSVEIRINEINKILIGEVNYISAQIDGKYLISIQLDQYLSEIAGIRKTNNDLIIRRYKGLKVPISCLKDINFKKNKAKIVIVDAHYATIKDVKIIGRDGEFAIVENLDKDDKNGIGLYDKYVTKPENVLEGQLIN